jgi:CheY-like chemotaxis protein
MYNSAGAMAVSADPKAVLEHLLNAARGSERRFLVGLPDVPERRRIAAIVAEEGVVVEATSTAEALGHLADESFELAFLSADDAPEAGAGDPLAAWRELRPFSDVVLIAPGEIARCAQAFGREVAAVFPRPLPEVDILLHAHVKRLIASRQVRTRGQLVLNAFNGVRGALVASHPELTQALSNLLAEAKSAPSISTLGASYLNESLGGVSEHASPDAVVASLDARQSVERAMEEARERYPGAALILVDEGASVSRLRDAIYGGVRAYLSKAELALLGRIAASVAARRRAEAVGMKLGECLTQFGVLSGEKTTHAPAATGDVDESLIADASAQKPGPAIIPTRHEVLVVDDEAVVLTVLREALRRGGYRVTTAASAEEAIDLMQKRPFDLVLTDKNLPGASGLDVLRAARALNPAPAIVLITGFSSLDSAVEALDTGAHDYIEKPIRDVEDLRARIRRALSRRDEQLARPRLAPTGRAGRVLLVEGEGTRRRLIADYLGRTYSVTTAEDGDEALERLQKEHFDLVLADRHLPGASGLRVIEHARRLLPHCASVLYTAYPSYESVKEAFASGVDAYLVRPSDDLKKLGDKVAEALGGRGGILLG